MPATIAKPVRLEGDELLAKVESLKGEPRSVLVRECGYVGTRKVKDKETGEFAERESLTFSEFSDALLKAKGVDLTPEKPAAGARGSTPGFRCSVMKSGQVVIGKAYTALANLEPGTEFAIEVGVNGFQLTKMDPATGEPEEFQFMDEGDLDD